MTRMIYCEKLGKEAERLEAPPYPGEIGQRIYKHISKQAWLAWLNHQTMLINEYRLSLIDPKSRQFLEQEMENFYSAAAATNPRDTHHQKMNRVLDSRSFKRFN